MFWRKKKQVQQPTEQELAQKHLAMIGKLYLEAVDRDRTLKRASIRNGIYNDMQVIILNYGKESTPIKNI